MTTDPFEALRLPVESAAPPADFVETLRLRLHEALQPVVELTATAAPAPAPASEPAPTSLTPPVTPEDITMAQTITPYLCVHDAAAALDWYRRTFRATIDNVVEWEGKIGHAEVTFGGATFYLSDEAPALGVLSPRSLGEGNSASYVVLVAAVDELVERAVAEGATLQRPVEDSYGTRNGWIVDPFGHRWNLASPLVDRAAAAAKRRPAEPYYLTITTPDVERAARFYGAVLDWQYSETPGGGRHVANTAMPMALRSPHNEFSTTVPGEVELWFTVRDFDDALERVRAAGGRVLGVTSYDSGREARCEDDQGVVFRFNEPAPGYDTDR